MTLLPGRDLGSELRQASVPLGSVPRCAATLCFCSTSWAPPIVPTAQPSHAVQSWPERTATFGKSMRDRPHAPHQPSSVTLRITGHQSSPAGRGVGAPVIELATRSTAFPLFSPARRAREPYLSRFSPAPPSVRASFPFIPSPPLSVCLASDAAPSEGNSAGAAECLRRGHTLAPVRWNDRRSGRGGLALSHLDDISSWKAKFEPNFFSAGHFPRWKSSKGRDFRTSVPQLSVFYVAEADCRAISRNVEILAKLATSRGDRREELPALLNYSPSLEGKYSEHGSPARRGAPSFRGTSLFVGGDTREGLVKINVARRAELSR